MKKYFGGGPVDKGLYLSLSMFELVRADESNPILPGSRDSKFVKAPAALAVVLGPVAGLAFVLFLPFVGLVSLVTFLCYKLVKLVQTLGARLFRPEPDDLQPFAVHNGEAAEGGGDGRTNRLDPPDR